MKRLFLFCMILVFLLLLTGCGNNAAEKTATTTESTTESTTAAVDGKEEQSESVLIDTQYYTMEVPSFWNENTFYEITEKERYNYKLSFYDKASSDAGYRGFLFSVDLLTEDEDYTGYPNYELLGSLEVYRIGVYNILVMYPTDMQCPEDKIADHMQLKNLISEILESISYKDECTFRKEAIEISTTAEPEPLFEGNFVGRWLGTGIGKRAPDGASAWNVEFRSDGTGTFEFFYEANDVVTTNFTYQTFDSGFGDSLQGIQIIVNGGRDLKFMVKFSWDNQNYKPLMTMYEVENGGPALGSYWVFIAD